MVKVRLCSLFGLFAAGLFSSGAGAVAVSGQGTWESTLQGRDLDGNPATFEAYYDTALDITWLASPTTAEGVKDWASANAWAAGLNVNGITGWRLPTNTPVNGSSYTQVLSNDGSTDWGYAATTTDGTDGGWRDALGQPVSEMGHMYYVTLGNRGFCDPAVPQPDCTPQPGWGLTNTGPFTFPDQTTLIYWSAAAPDSSAGWCFDFFDGEQCLTAQFKIVYEGWAVRDGDVVPVPAAVWLFGSGVLALAVVGRRKGGGSV